jgi:hypothetical protein
LGEQDTLNLKIFIPRIWVDEGMIYS